MTVFEIADQMLVVDAGLAFPRDEHLGVDLILPDFGYLHDRDVLAVVLTHAHEDHVGALPYLMREVPIREIWATRLTLGLVKSKLDEHGLLRATELREIEPEGAPLDLGPFRLEFVRMSHSVPDAVGIAIDDLGRPRLPHRRLEARPHAGRRPAHRRRQARRAGQPRRRPALRRLDERRAARLHAVRARRRGGVPPDHPGPAGPRPDLELRLEHPPDAAGDRRRRRDRPARWPSSAARCASNLNIARNLGYIEMPEEFLVRPQDLDELPPEPPADPLHGLAGRAAVGAHPDRLQRPPGDQGRARRHGDHLGAAGPGQRAARPRRDQPPDPERRRGAARGERAGARLRPRPLGGAAHAALARPPEGRDADPRRVPHAGGARPARAGRRRARRVDRDRRERRRRRAVEEGRPDRRQDRGRASRSSTGSASATSPTSPSATGATCPRTAC